jgi:hypothetical protein
MKAALVSDGTGRRDGVGAKVLLAGSNIRITVRLVGCRLPLRRSPSSLLSLQSLEDTLVVVVVVDHPSVELSPLPGEDSVVDPHLEDSEVHLEEVVPDSVVHHHLEEETLQLKLTNPKPSEMYFNNEFICSLVSKFLASAVTVRSPSC